MSASTRLVAIIVILSISGWCDDRFLEPFLPNGGKNVVRHSFYDVEYNEDTRTPKWVMFALSSLNTVHRFNRDKMFFGKDPQILKSPSASNYHGGGYDRGHLCPAEAMEFSEEAMRETFYTSNIAPQNLSFNRGLWKSLEGRVRKMLNTGSVLIVVAGVVHDKEQGYELIGLEKIGVPTHFYMIIYDVKKDRLSGFLMPNRGDVNGELADYLVPVGEISRRADVEFFKTTVEQSKRDKIDNIFE